MISIRTLDKVLLGFYTPKPDTGLHTAILSTIMILT